MSNFACYTCRKSSKKCDRTHPECQRCLTRHVKCEGYPPNFRFCGLAAKGRWKNKINPVTDEEEESQAHHKNHKKDTTTVQVIAESSAQGLRDEPNVLAGESNCQFSDTLDQEGQTHEASQLIHQVLAHPETEFYLQYFHSNVSLFFVPCNDIESPNSIVRDIVPLVYDHLGFLYSILALSAKHLGHKLAGLDDSINKKAVQFQNDALYYLNIEATSAIQEGISAHNAFIAGATMLLLSMLPLNGELIAEWDERVHALFYFACGSITGMDIDTNSETEAFDAQNYSIRPIILILLAWSDLRSGSQNPEFACLNLDSYQAICMLPEFEFVVGYSSDLFFFLASMVTTLRDQGFSTVASEWLSQQICQDAIATIDACQQQIRGWTPSVTSAIANGADSLWLSRSFQAAIQILSRRYLSLLPVAQGESGIFYEGASVQTQIKCIIQAAGQVGDMAFMRMKLLWPLSIARQACMCPETAMELEAIIEWIRESY